MIVNKNTIDLVKKYEGLSLKAYLCPANVWTIGFGSTFYANGVKVKRGDIISLADAESLLHHTLESFASQLVHSLQHELTENQFGAIVSFSYNVGVTASKGSTLLKKVNSNPQDELIGLEFMKWVKAKGVILPGLVARRKAEKDLYFSV
jgi:lysozyme